MFYSGTNERHGYTTVFNVCIKQMPFFAYIHEPQRIHLLNDTIETDQIGDEM